MGKEIPYIVLTMEGESVLATLNSGYKPSSEYEAYELSILRYINGRRYSTLNQLKVKVGTEGVEVVEDLLERGLLEVQYWPGRRFLNRPLSKRLESLRRSGKRRDLSPSENKEFDRLDRLESLAIEDPFPG